MQKSNSKGNLKKEYKKSLSQQIYDRKSLKRFLKQLNEIKKRKLDKLKGDCVGKESSEVRTDSQVKLRCHQLPNVVQELRKAVIRQDWDETVILLMVLCHPGLKLYTSIILRTCCILFFNHKNSNINLLQDFIRLITGYILDEDVNKFIRILFALRKSALTTTSNGKLVRQTGDYKVTRDFEFENLSSLDICCS